jgi:hypothetical protein
MSIKIGNNNKIKGSSIGHQNNSNKNNNTPERKSFAERHPIIISFFVSIIGGVILLFSFWKNIITWLEGIF